MKYDWVKYKKYYYWFIVLYISVIIFKIMMGLHAHNFTSLCSAAQGVTLGKPHWLAYQNRLLGPYLVEWIAYMSNCSYCAALHLFNAITILVEYLILYYVLLKFSKDSYGLSLNYLIYFSVMLLGIQHHWSYTWDHIDIIVFTIFAYFIFTKKSIKYLVFLFFLEILNRESALFIALFLMIDSFHFKLPLRSIKISLQNKTKLLIGSFLLIIGIIYTKLIRELLFVESSIKHVGSDLAHQAIGNHFNLFRNIKTFTMNFVNQNFFISIFILSIIIFLFSYLNKFNEVQLKASILFFILLSSILAFGSINETRMYAILLPFLLFFHLSLKKKNFLDKE